MFKRLFVSGFFVLLISIFSLSYASNDNFSEVEVKVFNYSEANKIKAFKSGLKEAFVKISASEAVLELDSVQAAIQSVNDYVSKFNYFSRNQELYLNIKYNIVKIKGLLESNKVALPNQQRPSVLAWVAIDNDSGIKLLGNANFAEIENSILEQSNKLGIPLIFPMLDLTEQLSITPFDVVNFNLEVIEPTIKNYDAEAILIGSVFKFDSSWQFKWKLKYKDKIVTWFDKNQDLNAGFTNILKKLKDKLLVDTKSTQQLVNLDALDSGTLKLSISGVRSLDEYTAIEDYLYNKFSDKVNAKIELLELADRVAIFTIDSKEDKKVILDTLKLDNFLTQDKTSVKKDRSTLDFKINL